MATLRDHVSFRVEGDALFEPMDAAADLARHAKARPLRIRVRPHRSYSGAITARVYWQGDRFHTVRFASTATGALLVSHSVADGRELSLMLHDWLSASDRFTDICWRTREQWKAGAAGRDTPA